MRARLVVLIAILAGLAFASPARAAEVNAQCTDPEAADYLQTRLDDSVADDVITLEEGSFCDAFALEHDAFRLPAHRIVLQGNTTGDPEVLDGDGETRILDGTDIGQTVIRHLTFSNGATRSGSALFVDGKSAPTLSDLKIVANESGDRGAVTIVPGGGGDTVTVEDSSFGSAKPDGSPNPDDANTAGRGGGLFIDTAHAIVLARNHFTGNEARTQGGGAVLSLGIADESAAGAPVTVTGNTFSGNTVRDPESGGDHVGGGLAVITPFHGFRSLTQSDNTFEENLVVPATTFQGPKLLIGFAGTAAGGGEYTEVSALSTNDRFVKNSIGFPVGTARAARGDGFSDIFGGGLAVSGVALGFEGRNLVAAGNAIDFGEGAGISLDRQSVSNDTFTRSQTASTLTLLDSSVVANDAGLGTGGAIRGSFDDHLIVHNGIIFNNTSEGQEIAGFDDGGSVEIRFTDYCAPTPAQEAGRGDPADGNICVDPQLVDPPNGDVHQKKAISPTIEVGSNDLVPEDLTGDWDRPTADPRISDSGTDGARVDMGADEVPAEEPEPTVTPTPTPTVTPTTTTPATPPAAAVLGAQQKSCVSRRAFGIRLRVPRGQKASSATVRVNGKRVQVIRGTRLRAPVVLRGLPKGMFAVRISIKLASGRTVTGTRRYLTCIPRREGGIPRV